MTKFIFMILVITFGFSQKLFSQIAVIPAGGDTSNGSGSIAYSIGQVDYHFVSTTSGTISEGVQQVVRIDSSVNSFEFVKNSDIRLSPSPFNEYLSIDARNFGSPRLRFKIFNASGTLAMQVYLNEPFVRVSTSSLPSGMYTVVIFSGQQYLGNNKLIKSAQ